MNLPSFRSKKGKRGKRISYPISSRKREGLNEYEITLKSDNPTYQGEYGIGPNPPIVVHARSQMAARRKITLPRDVRIVSIKRVGSSIKEKRPRNIDEEVAQVMKIERELGHPEGGREESPRERWAKYPLPSEAIETQTYKERYDYYIRQGDISAAANEKAINDAIKVLREERLKLLSGGE